MSKRCDLNVFLRVRTVRIRINGGQPSINMPVFDATSLINATYVSLFEFKVTINVSNLGEAQRVHLRNNKCLISSEALLLRLLTSLGTNIQPLHKELALESLVFFAQSAKKMTRRESVDVLMESFVHRLLELTCGNFRDGITREKIIALHKIVCCNYPRAVAQFLEFGCKAENWKILQYFPITRGNMSYIEEHMGCCDETRSSLTRFTNHKIAQSLLAIARVNNQFASVVIPILMQRLTTRVATSEK